MTDTQKALTRFAIDYKLVVEFYGDMHGAVVRARYTDDNIEHSTVVQIGTMHGGSLHTIGSATEEAIQRLLNAAT